MKTIILPLISILLIMSSCEKENASIRESSKPKTITCRCQDDSNDKFFHKVKRKYKGNLLREEKIFRQDKLSDSIVYSYNDFDLLDKEEHYHKAYYSSQKYYSYNEVIYIYNEDQKLKQKIIKHFKIYDNGSREFEKEYITDYYYENGLLIKSCGALTCGSNICNEYEYNNNNELIKLSVFSDKGKNLYDSYHYEYRYGYKVSEIKKGYNGKIRYVKKFIYDRFWHLIRVEEDGNVIEENKYFFNKLIEKKTWYYGIDPGYYPCLGNYIYEYEY